MNSLFQKSPKRDLRNYYNIFLEGGIIAALIVLIILFKIPFNPKNTRSFTQPEQETVKMEDIVQTKQDQIPPPPPQPQTPVAVPNDEVIADAPVNLNTELDINAPLNVPPPPKTSTKEQDENRIFIAVQHMPELIGGLAALQSKIHYPELARKAGIEGSVYVEFYVDEQGNVRNAHVVRGIGGGCDEEALRVVKQAKFKPGLQRGRPVKVHFSLPVIFRLQQ